MPARPIADLSLDPGARAHDPGESPRRGGYIFPKEADTLTAHDVPARPRRDTVPIPPLPSIPPSPPTLRDPAARARLELQAETLGEEHLESVDDDTETHHLPRVQAADEPTSPTLSLACQSDAAREVYRLFLASEYAPALALGSELLALGLGDPMLVAIVRECRATLASLPPGSAGPPSALRPPALPGDHERARVRAFDAATTLGEVAHATGLTVQEIVEVFERIVAPPPADRSTSS